MTDEKPLSRSRIQFELAKAETRKEVLGLALGAASTCWESLEGTGVFDDTQANLILNDTFYRLQELDATEEAGWADWFETNATNFGGKYTWTADEIAAALRGPRPFGVAAGL